MPPPPADCTAVVESPARKKAGGFALGVATAVDVKDANVASRGIVENCILTEGTDKAVISDGFEPLV